MLRGGGTPVIYHCMHLWHSKIQEMHWKLWMLWITGKPREGQDRIKRVGEIEAGCEYV